MILPQFEFHEPTSIGEACDLMAQHRGKARPLAGGTDLLVNMKKNVLRPERLVSLGRIAEMAALGRSNGELWIGAGVTVAEIAASAAIARDAPALGQGARALGTPLIRNLATVGGNIGSARPAADLPPALMVYDAMVVLRSAAGERRMPINEFFKGPGITAAREEELVGAVVIHVPSGYAGAGYLNLGVRKAQDCNIVNVASFLELDERGESIRTARVALGAVGPTPLRSPSAESVLVGGKPTEALFEQAADAATRDCTPILDFRGSAQYRRDMVGVLARRTLAMALADARSRN
ncbi:MAG: xanthine dehydrogenase family protein subunit M [Desulfobacterales bacterium]|jgi:carbon-monoxide dehydrogenase medium subunit|nr:xanthine dehydrogenase family protein subunit M [Desulfobacterales bacterium]